MSTLTPTERAEQALTNPRALCDLLAQGRQYRAPGWWDGSAFRSHPCGIVRGTIKLTNHWHVDQHATIEITDGIGWDVAGVCNDPRAYGNPHPKPTGGAAVRVFGWGKWEKPEYEAALRAPILNLLAEAAEWIAMKQEAERAANEKAAAERAAQAARIESAAIAAATQEPAC